MMSILTTEQQEAVRALKVLCLTDNPDQGRPKVSYGFMRDLLATIGPLMVQAEMAEDKLEKVQQEADKYRAEAAKAAVAASHMRDRLNARDT